MNYSELFRLALPEVAITLTALAVLAVDFVGVKGIERRFRVLVLGLVAVLGCVLGGAFLLNGHGEVTFQGGMLVIDPMVRIVKAAILVLTLFTVLISVDSSFTDHFAEYLALVLMATVGMMLLVSTAHLLMIFLALELTSLSLYILAAFNKRNRKSAEAALKYFLFGGIAAAFTLFGLSLVYGLSGELLLPKIAESLADRTGNPLLMLALVMTVIGLGFKIAAAPFHLWAPDAYQGAPTPSAALIATGSKVAGFYVLATVMHRGFRGVEGIAGFGNFASGWVPTLALIAVLSMIVGNLAAIVQNSVKRLLAYSAIAHAGYALLAILANNGQGTVSLVYYVITYGLTTLGAFGVVSVVEDADGQVRLSDLAGMSQRAPLLSFCMLIFMLSLAGIPPLAGFFGKFYVFVAAAGGTGVKLQLLWIVILAIAMSCVSLYYYLQVLKRIYVAEAATDKAVVKCPIISTTAIVLLATLVVVLGVMPNLLVGPLAAMLGNGGH